MRGLVSNKIYIIHICFDLWYSYIYTFFDFIYQTGQLPHKHKIVIAGNHELSFDNTFTHPFQNLANATDRDRLHTGIHKISKKNLPLQ